MRQEGSLQQSETLLNIAEIAVAFAGFSSIVVLFRNREAGAWDPIDAFRYRVMLGGSLATAAFSVLPLVVFWLSVPTDQVWRVSSGVLFVWFVVLIVGQLRIRPMFPSLSGQARWILFLLISVGAATGLALNCAGVAFNGAPSQFMLGITWILFLSGWQFLQLVGLPLGIDDEPTA
jgi:hypothetical protein